jgi:hypothetical protein
MAAVIQDATPLVLINSSTITATGNSATFQLPEAECYGLVLSVTAASGTTPTDNIILQTAMDGSMGNPPTTAALVLPAVWVNTGNAFGTVSTTGTQMLYFKPTLSVGETASVVTVTAGTASAKNGPIRRQFMRLSHTITGTTPSFTYTLYALANPKGFSTV